MKTLGDFRALNAKVEWHVYETGNTSFYDDYCNARNETYTTFCSEQRLTSRDIFQRTLPNTTRLGEDTEEALAELEVWVRARIPEAFETSP